jgi:hypothetical protein
METENTPTVLDSEDFEEFLARNNKKDWTSLIVVSEHIRERLNLARDAREIGKSPASQPIRCYPREGVIGLLDGDIALRIVTHVGFGYRVLCPAASHPIVSASQHCALCEDYLASEAMRREYRWLIPLQVHARNFGDGWRWFKDASSGSPSWLELDETLVTALSGNGLTRGVQLERDSAWKWRVDLEDHVPPWTVDRRVRFRRGLLAPRIPDYEENVVAEAVKVAGANCYRSPRPGRTAEVLKWLPAGAVLVPCHFASKKPRVLWSTGWTVESFAEFGEVRADKGNLAVLMGLADIRSFDWDTDDLYWEFVEINRWAKKAQQSFGARGGNVWCIMDLPSDFANCMGLVRDEPGGPPKKVGEWRAGNCLTTISGAHPSGNLYRVENPGCLPFIRVQDVRWPKGVRLDRQEKRQTEEYKAEPGEISLDLTRIENLIEHPRHPSSLQGRCPVCARSGNDRKGEHLEIWPSGAFKCIRGCSGSEIFQLIGRRHYGNQKHKTARGGGQRRFITKPVTYDIPKSHTQ